MDENKEIKQESNEFNGDSKWLKSITLWLSIISIIVLLFFVFTYDETISCKETYNTTSCTKLNGGNFVYCTYNITIPTNGTMVSRFLVLHDTCTKLEAITSPS